MLPETVRQAKRVLKLLAGFMLLGAGIIMLVTPGPGWVAIALGLALLAGEFSWARKLLKRVKAGGGRLRDVFRRSAPPKEPSNTTSNTSL